MKITVIDSIESLYRLEGSWRDLAEKIGGCDFYTSFEWFTAFLNSSNSPPSNLKIFEIKDDDGIVAIIPMCLAQRKMRLFELTALEFIGNVFSPYRSAIADHEKVGRIVLEFVDYLLTDFADTWDVIVLDDVSRNDPFVVSLDAQLQQKGIKSKFKELEQNIQIDLSKFDEPDEYFRSLSKKLRQNLRTSINRITKDGEIIVLLQADSNAKLVKVMDDYYEVYNNSWKEEERDEYFHRKLGKYMAECNKLRLFQLYFKPFNTNEKSSDPECGGASLNDIKISVDASIIDEDYIPIASQYFIVHNKIGYCLKMSYKSDFSKYGPGAVLLWLACRYLMINDYINKVDFQKGADDYKLKWGDYVESRYQLRVANPKSISMKVETFLDHFLVPMVRIIRDRIKNLRSVNLSKYFNPRKNFLNLIEYTAPIAQTFLRPAEWVLSKSLSKGDVATFSPIFIIGPPRSGTTLLYRLLTNRFDLSYISNLTNLLYKIPLFSLYLEKYLSRDISSATYNFDYGYIPGHIAPHEGGNLWGAWFPKRGYISSGETTEDILSKMRLVLNGMMKIKEVPVVMKSTHHSMIIAPIIEAFPNARFIVCTRDYENNAISILKARTSRKENGDKWWSAIPKEAKYLKDHSLEFQSAAQVYYIHQQINEDRELFGKERFYDIKYEELCNDVCGELEKLKKYLSRDGSNLTIINDVPNRFKISTGDPFVNERGEINKAFTHISKTELN